MVMEAMAALDSGDIIAAERGLSDALDWDPDHIEARLARGRCLRDMGDISGAMSDFLKCQASAPHAPEAHIEIGNLFFARKDYGRAITHYTDALAIDPSHTLALCRRGISHHYRRRPARALEDLSEARQIDPSISNIDRYIQMVSAPNSRQR
jgi:tetratricopeptide (TPR) repeat protein